MPTPEELEQFKQVLQSLGAETDILAKRDEEAEEVPAPEEGLSPELSKLLAPMEEGGLDTLDFESLFGEKGEGAEAAAEAPPEEEKAPELESLVPAAEGEETFDELDIPEGFELAAGPAEEGIGAPGVAEAAEVPPEGGSPAEEELTFQPEPLEAEELAPAGPGAAAEAGGQEEISLEDLAFPQEAAAEVPEGGVGEEFALPQEFQLPEEGVAPAEEGPAGEAALAEEGEALAEGAPAGPEEVGFPPEMGFPLGEVEVPAAEAPVSFQPAEKAGGEAPAEAPVSFQPAEEALAGGEEELKLDDFSLQGLGEAFGVSEAEAQALPGEAIPAPPGEERAPEGEVEAAEEELSLSDKDFEALKRSLAALPRNLKMAVEELIGVQGLSGEKLRGLVGLLVSGASPAQVAARVRELTGKVIVLPRGYEKGTGLALEAERATFAYAFRQNILPILRVFGLSLVFLALLFYVGYRYVYRPLYATALYRQGYANIQKDRFPLANESFGEAVSIWPAKSWHYRYAEAFAAKKQYLLAKEKYEQLLARWPLDHRGTLDYAALESLALANYEHAEKLLKGLLDKNLKDYDALLATGDNYLEWAAEDPARFEAARFSYASILDYYGQKNEVLFRMLKYFIRTDQLGEVKKLKRFLEGQKELKVDPAAYAELGGYLLDRQEYGEVPDTLFKAMAVKRELPEIHYHLARYFLYARDPGEEEKALHNTLAYLKELGALSKKRLAIQIDAYNRLGRLMWRKKEYLRAEENYQKAIALLEQGQKSGIFGSRSGFGEVYSNRGDIYYYVERGLETALAQYRLAERNGYGSVELDFKTGYIHYLAGQFEEALLRFVSVVDAVPASGNTPYPRSENALFCLASSLFQRGDYFAAQGYYLRLLDLLEYRKNVIPFLEPANNPEHRSLVEFLMKAYNNLGVAYLKLSERTGDPEKNAKALVNLTFSSQYFDLLSRDPGTLVRGLTKNLAYLNQRAILYPQPGYAPQIYNRLPLDLEAAQF